MPISARVAVVGGGLLRSNFDSAVNDMPYASRPSVDVEVEPGDTLYATMAKAADLLDVRMEDGSDPLRAVTWIAFYDARDDDMLDRSRYISARDLTLVDESGLLTWRNTFEQTSLAS